MWYSQPIPRRAPAGGIIDPLNGLRYRGGELLPFYVPRSIMPQVDAADYEALADFIRGRDVEVLYTSFRPDLLRAHQRIDRIHAELMDAATRAKPVLVSADRFILDGNHRWLTHVLAGEPFINAVQIMQPFEAAVETLFAFPRTYTLENHAETN